MHYRELGTTGLELSAIGFGAWAIGGGDWVEGWGPQDDAESIAAIHRALEIGVNFLDTADMYGPHTNEELVGKAIAGKRNQFVIATKFGIVRDPNNPAVRGINGNQWFLVLSCVAVILFALGRGLAGFGTSGFGPRPVDSRSAGPPPGNRSRLRPWSRS